MLVAFEERHVFTNRRIDSVLYLDSLGNIRDVYKYTGAECLNLSPYYLSLHGRSFLSFENGAPYFYEKMVIESFHPKDNRRTRRIVRSQDSVTEISYHENGNISRLFECDQRKSENCELNFKNEWYASGKPYIEQKMHDGKHKVHRHYYESGRIMTETFYIGTKLDSVYTSYHESGRIHQRIKYDMGREIEVREWDEQGNEVKR